MSAATISVIIPTLNAGGQLDLLLSRLKSQTVSSEILVIDSSSEDNTLEIARSYGVRTMTVGRGEFDHGGTRTSAGKASTGELLVFMTQDALPAGDTAIETLAGPFEDSTVGAAYGRQLPVQDASPFAAHLRHFNYPERSQTRILQDRSVYGIRTPFLSNSFAAYRRAALSETGWFKEGLIMSEDTWAGARLLLAGYKIAYEADAAVYHSHNYTPAEEFRRYFRIGIFHGREDWILREFGGAGGEGLAYVKSAVDYLIRTGHALLLPEFVLRTALKLAGYRLGRLQKYLHHS